MEAATSIRATAVDSAFSGAQYLMGLQLFVKLATFSMNAVVICLAGREAFGVASVRFELLLSTILFLSREGMRSALLRIDADRNAGIRVQPSSDRSSVQSRRPPMHEQRIINAALLPIGAGMAMAGALYIFFGTRNSASGLAGTSADTPHYYLSLALYVWAACIELCIEPLFALSRSRVLFKLQAKCEGIAVAGRCIVVVLALLAGRSFSAGVVDSNPLKLVAFAAGQIAYASLILLSYLRSMSCELEYPVWACYIPRKVALGSEGRQKSYIGPAVRGLAVTFVGQSLLKHLLTQGDNMVMARFATPAEMGVFAFVTNYGSIPARIVFLPLEEASRAMFSKMVSSHGSSAETGSADYVSMSTGDARTARHVLTTLGKLHLLVGSILVAFGTLLSPTLLSFVGQNDSPVAHALTAYCIYLPLMGMNGFLEAFVHCVATKKQLLRISIWMAAFTVAYALFAVQMLRGLKLGSAGMVMANMLNMALRIGYCWRFISQWFGHLGVGRGPQLAAMLPHPAVLYACLLSGAVIAAAMAFSSQQYLHNRAATLAAGSALGIVVLRQIWRFEQPFVQSVLALRSGQPRRPRTE
ncbi:Oligosaccharide translocation protein rft1 [Coemansia sp. RSA 2424]|nr:Oligosaccharide translocation protein rft1 [Coemansia sp. RSA 2424]